MSRLKLNYVEGLCLALCVVFSSVKAASSLDEASLSTRIVEALRAKEPDWKYIATIESGRMPLVPSEKRIITGVWSGPKSPSQNVIVSVYSVESRVEAAAWLRPVRDRRVAVGWQVGTLQIGDEGYLSTYKNGDRFDIEFRIGTVVAKIGGNDLKAVKQFSLCIAGQVPAN